MLSGTIQTVFSPMTQARNLVGPDELLLHIRLHPDVIKDAFQIITDQTIRFIEAARETGISGIFYALQWASHLDLSESEYREFARPYDLQILPTGTTLTKLFLLNIDHGQALLKIMKS